MATVLAIITWAGVVYASNPPGEKTIFVPVPQDTAALPAGFVLVHPIADLALRISGTQQHINQFSTNSLRIKVHYEEIRNTGSFDLPMQVTNLDPNVELVGAPDSVSVDVDRLQSAQLPVKVIINPDPPPGYIASTPQTDPQTITVTGPSHELTGLQPRVTLNLGSQKANFEGDVTVFLYDASGKQLQDVNATPPTVRVLVTISAVSTKRASAVLPPLKGNVASGYELTGVIVNPISVTLSGPQDILNTLDSVSTDSIDITGLTQTTTYTVSVHTPAGVAASPLLVSVTVEVAKVPQASPTASPTPTG